MNIQWYPGHMTKAIRMMKENIKLIDCVVELLDARTPVSSMNPELKKLANGKPRLIVFTKMDLADPNKTDEWINYYKEQGILAMAVNARDGKNMKQVVPMIQEVCKEKLARNKRRGLVNKPLRIMVAGIPNVGKSTFINKLVGKSSAKTGNKPGVTKGKQWIKLRKDIELLDTPGVLWPKFEDKTIGLHLAFIGSINDNIVDREELARLLLIHLEETYPGIIKKNFAIETENKEAHIILNDLAIERNYLMEGSKADTLRMGKALLDDFRGGRLGRITVDTIEMIQKV